VVTYADVSTQRVTAGNAIEYAYRDLGDGAVPLVLLQHFRGNSLIARRRAAISSVSSEVGK
jgi:hypothetical protein